MHQTMQNIAAVLQQHQLGFGSVFKCTLMLADIQDWPAANTVYMQYLRHRYQREVPSPPVA
jgi:enamine deaminase RidA (YjgF/YER057c/UK114 family)